MRMTPFRLIGEERGSNVAQGTDTAGIWAGRVALGIFAMLSLICIILGGSVFGASVEAWYQSHDGLQDLLSWIFGLAGAAVVAAGLLFAGLAFRFMRWNGAPMLSLLLSILSAGFVIFTYSVFSTTGNPDDSIEIVFLQGICIVLLLVVALLPFLHWLLARRKPAVAPGGNGK
jgi:hypothetical protein